MCKAFSEDSLIFKINISSNLSISPEDMYLYFDKCTLINLVNISVNLSKSRILSKKKLFQACFWLKILLILSYFISVKAAVENSSLYYLRIFHAILCKFCNGTRTYKHYSFFYLRFFLNQFSRFYLFCCFLLSIFIN